MDITEIDKNFELPPVNEPDVEWFDVNDAPFSLHGITYCAEEKKYRRMPDAVAKTVSDGVKFLATNTTGGRVRFITDSPYVAVKCVLPLGYVMAHMPAVGSHGVSLYADGTFVRMFTSSVYDLVNTGKDVTAFNGIHTFSAEKSRKIELYLPLYNGLYQMYVGVKKGSTIQAPPPYSKKQHVVFYGSSITQGGCASRPGNDYVSHLSRWLDFDFTNLGFSGSGKAEPQMRDYLASMPADVYVLDYDYNATTVEYLEQTHYPLYETIRNAKKNAPILFISKPDFDVDPSSAARRAVIYKTYETAKANGDDKVFFIDGETLFHKEERDACTVDTCHPNDLGFYRMAQTIRPVLEHILNL